MEYDIIPMAKPRMTSSDKFKKRTVVLKYWAFKDEVRLKKLDLPLSGYHVIFYIPMPKSWKPDEKEEMNNEPHMQVPDVDNLLKALMDAIYDSDCKVWDVRVTKRWRYEGGISIKPIFQ